MDGGEGGLVCDVPKVIQEVARMRRYIYIYCPKLYDGETILLAVA